jgi:hypothetical protein
MGMKKGFSTVGIVVALALLTCMASSAAADSASITLLNDPGDLLELGVGETYTFHIKVTSDADFILAMAMPDVYYPGRAIVFSGNDIAHRDDSAVLHLTMTGKGSTADFAAVCDWPELGTECWPEGTVPVSIVVGARYRAGVVVSERFSFAVVVP